MASSATRIAVLINEHSGLNPRPDSGEKIQALFAAAGAAVRLERVRHGGDLAARAAGRRPLDVLVAAGGDGTVGSVAGIAVETNATFGVLPLGTLNHFARDAGITLELPEAVQTIVHGRVRDVDVGDLNGRIFVNNSSLGIYPRMVWERNVEQHHGRGKWTAFVIAMARTWRRYRMLVARMSIDQRVHVVRTPFIFVGNNGSPLAGSSLARAGRSTAAVCGSSSRRVRRFEILTLPLRAKANRLTAGARFQRFLAEEVTIELSRRHVSAAFDGEVAIVRTPLHFASAARPFTFSCPARHRPEGSGHAHHRAHLGYSFRADRFCLVERLSAAIARISPDLLAVSGDLTQRAKRSEFTAARTFLDALPFPRLVVPGNHDVPLYDLFARFVTPLVRYSRAITPDLVRYSGRRAHRGRRQHRAIVYGGGGPNGTRNRSTR